MKKYGLMTIFEAGDEYKGDLSHHVLVGFDSEIFYVKIGNNPD